MVMVAGPRQKRCLFTVTLHQIHTHHVSPESYGPLKVRDLQMRVPDAGFRHAVHFALRARIAD
jgi:hypothetical protein